MSRHSARTPRPTTAPRPARCRSTWFKPRLECLEGRAVPATCVWDGGPTGNGTDFLDAVNWVDNAPPQAGDDVVLGNSGGNPTIVINGAVTVNSVESSREISVNGGPLTVSSASNFSGRFHNTGTVTLGGSVEFTGGTTNGGTITGAAGTTLTFAGPFTEQIGSSQVGRVNSEGSVEINGSFGVEWLDNFAPQEVPFTIFDIQGDRGDAFGNLPEGAFVPVSGTFPITISYVGGNGNDVVLTPTVGAGGLYTIPEGAPLPVPVTFQAVTYTNPPAPLNYSWDVDGDGDFDDATGASPTITWNLGLYDGTGNYTVRVRVEDADGDLVGSAPATVSVANVAPTATVTLLNTADLFPSQPPTFTLSATDPSPVDQASDFTFHITITRDGDDQVFVDENVVGRSGTQATYALPSASEFTDYTVRVTARDKDGAVGADHSLQIRVYAYQFSDGNLIISSGPDSWNNIIISPGEQPGAILVQVSQSNLGSYLTFGPFLAPESITIYGYNSTWVTLNGTSGRDHLTNSDTLRLNERPYYGENVAWWEFYGHGGDDRYTLKADGVFRAVHFDGGDDTDTLTLSEVSEPLTWTLGQEWAHVGGGPYGLYFADVENIEYGSGDNTFVFEPDRSFTGDFSTSPQNDTVIFGADFEFTGNLFLGAGNDIVKFEDGAEVTGTIYGETGVNTLDYSARTAPISVPVDLSVIPQVVGQVTGFSRILGSASGNDALIGHSGQKTWTLNPLLPFDLLDPLKPLNTGVVGGLAFESFEVLEGSGQDEIVGGESYAWHITADGAGNVTAYAQVWVPVPFPGRWETRPFTTSFTGMNDVAGGPGDDRFILHDGVVFSGTLDGGTADIADTLEYPSTAAPLSIDLASPTFPNDFPHVGTLIGVESIRAPEISAIIADENSGLDWWIAGNEVSVSGYTFRGVRSLACGDGADQFFMPTDFPVGVLIESGGGDDSMHFVGGGDDVGTPYAYQFVVVNLQTREVRNGFGSLVTTFDGIAHLVNTSAFGYQGRVDGPDSDSDWTINGDTATWSSPSAAGSMTLTGFHVFNGGDHTDQFVVTAAPPAYQVFDDGFGLHLDGGAGGDTYDITFGDLAGPVKVSDTRFASDSDKLTIRGTENNDVLRPDKHQGTVDWEPVPQPPPPTPPKKEQLSFDGIDAPITLRAGAGHDTINDPNSGDFLFFGEAGDDTIIIQDTTGPILADGGEGTDTYVVNTGNLRGPVSLADTGAAGTDTVIVNGTPGDDAITQTGAGVVANGAAIGLGGGLEALTVNGNGGAGDTFTVVGTPAVAATVEGVSDTIVNGTAGGDTIVVTPVGSTGRVAVHRDGQLVGTYRPTRRLVVHGLNGDDDLQVAGSINIPVLLYGDDGHDRLKGGDGDDILLGGSGNDEVLGGGGRDLMSGGTGADRLVGNGGDDLFIAGWTAHDGNAASLESVMREWTRTDRTYQQRVAALRAGGGWNGPIKLDATTVFSDDDADDLTGSSGSDWFLYDARRDRIHGLGGSELVDDFPFLDP